MIAMKSTSDKSQLNFIQRATEEAQERYDAEVSQFQHSYNEKHPLQHIWRHIIAKRRITVLYESEDVSVVIQVVRFVYAHTSQTFTFYGTLLLRRTHYAFHLLRKWIGSRPANLSRDVEKRWASFVSVPEKVRVSDDFLGA